MATHTHTHSRARMRECLSSERNLNKVGRWARVSFQVLVNYHGDTSRHRWRELGEEHT